MINKLLNKFKINRYAMLKHGTVAVATMFGVWILFGVKNIMIAFPIALTSSVVGRQNFKVKTFNKSLKIIFLNLIIVTFSYISSINILFGIPINFISMFLIMYSVISPYDPTFYKPFIMMYVFTQYSDISFVELPIRFLAVIYGVLIVIFGSSFNKANEKSILGKNVTVSFELLKGQLDNIINNKFNNNVTIECSDKMRDLAYRIYITRHKKYLTTNLGKIQFMIYINIEYLNLILKNINIEYNENKIKFKVIKDLIIVIDNILDYSSNKLSIYKLEEVIDVFIDVNKKDTTYIREVLYILKLLLESFFELESLKKRDFNKIYKEWERSGLDKSINTFKEYFHPDTIRFKFAMRMSISLTITLLLGEIFGFYKIIWVIITIMSTMQAYYEDTLSRAKERVLGNIIAIIFTGIIINIVNIKSVTIIILILSLYLIYGFKEYYKISIFTSIASLCIASLTENINKLIFYRIGYVFIGVVLVLLANKLVFPYKNKDGIFQLKNKILKLKYILINESDGYIKGKNEAHKIRDIIIHSTLLSQKLYLRNLQYESKEIDGFIIENNDFIIRLGYKTLMKIY
ncbi:hypothetical protein JCM1393_26490 [Clostridium carnis]